MKKLLNKKALQKSTVALLSAGLLTFSGVIFAAEKEGSMMRDKMKKESVEMDDEMQESASDDNMVDDAKDKAKEEGDYTHDESEESQYVE